MYGVLPASALFMVLYAKLSNALSKKALFYVTSVPFFIFYALFCTVIYPNRHHLMPNVRSSARSDRMRVVCTLASCCALA